MNAEPSHSNGGNLSLLNLSKASLNEKLNFAMPPMCTARHYISTRRNQDKSFRSYTGTSKSKRNENGLFIKIGDKLDYFDGKLDSYSIETEIGRGSYSIVKKGLHYGIPDREYALKIYDKQTDFTVHRRRDVKREIQNLVNLSNPYIVHLCETIENKDNLFLVFEYVRGGSLFDYINSNAERKLNEQEAKRIFTQIVTAVQYCHKNNVVHRDLKLDNILLDDNKDVKVIDFGFSVVVNTVCKLNLFCGTSLYLAPEIVLRKDYWGPPVDVWTLGVILYTMLTGRFPFNGKTKEEIYKSITRGIYIEPCDISQGAQEMIEKLLNKDPAQRPTCDEILKNPFVTMTFDEKASLETDKDDITT